MKADPGPVKQAALDLGFDTVGVCSASPAESWGAFRSWLDEGRHGTMAYLQRHAEIRQGAERLLPGAKSVVAVTLNYLQPNPAVPGSPRIARYALGKDYHKVLRRRLHRLAAAVRALHEGSETRVCVDSAPILEREYAHRAGLGWFGKNTMLIDSRRGSWFFLGLLVTTVDLGPDEPAQGGCGTCRRCVDACPTGAIVLEDGLWQVDARSCISYQTIENRGDLGTGLHGWTFGCDVCQEVCPFNAPRPGQPLRAVGTTVPEFLDRRSWPSLEDVAAWDPEAWDRATQGSAVRRAGFEGLRRNAKRNLRESNGRSGSC